MLNMQSYEDVAVINLEGELGPQEIDQVGRTLISLLHKHQTKMVLNFQGVEHVHYPSIHPLINAIMKLKRYSGDLKFAGMNSYTKSIFRFMGVTDSVENFETVPEAVLAFRSDWRTWH